MPGTNTWAGASEARDRPCAPPSISTPPASRTSIPVSATRSTPRTLAPKSIEAEAAVADQHQASQGHRQPRHVGAEEGVHGVAGGGGEETVDADLHAVVADQREQRGADADRAAEAAGDVRVEGAAAGDMAAHGGGSRRRRRRESARPADSRRALRCRPAGGRAGDPAMTSVSGAAAETAKRRCRRCRGSRSGVWPRRTTRPHSGRPAVIHGREPFWRRRERVRWWGSQVRGRPGGAGVGRPAGRPRGARGWRAPGAVDLKLGFRNVTCRWASGDLRRR